MLDVKEATEVLSREMLTLPEVARLLKMSVHTLRKTPAWLVRLEAIKVAGKWLVPVANVHAVLTGER